MVSLVGTKILGYTISEVVISDWDGCIILKLRRNDEVAELVIDQAERVMVLDAEGDELLW